ncbi:MAG: hypothetical protein ACW99A_03230 [Candidatus Kariarchaeaceae archaeon]
MITDLFMAEYFLVILFVSFLFYLGINKSTDSQDKNRFKSAYGRVSRTLRGKLVRSKGEKKIADWLASHGIHYIYEPRLSKFKPDFFIPDHKLIIEFYGLRDASGHIGENYRKKISEKNEYYRSLNVRFLEIYQEDLTHLDQLISTAIQNRSTDRNP